MAAAIHVLPRVAEAWAKCFRLQWREYALNPSFENLKAWGS